MTLALVLTTDLSSAGAIETETFRVTPSPQTLQGFERRSFAFDPAPGESVVDAVRVTNLSDETRTFRLYAVDARTDPESGRVTVDSAAATPSAVGAWVEFETDTLELSPGDSEVVTFTLSRPPDAPAEGVGGVVVEETIDTDDAGGIDVVYRLAMLIRLGGDVAGLRVSEPRLHPPVELFPSSSRASVTMTNETLEPVSANVAFSAAGLTGRYWELGDEEVRLDPGETREVTASWSTVPRWGGLFSPAVTVAWERGSTVRTGPRALHTPIWVVALVLLVTGIRGTRELTGDPRE